MNAMRQKITVVFAALILLPFALQGADTELSIPRVAQNILEGDGYHFFSFSSKKPTPLLLTATLDGQTAKILDIPASKNVVLAIKIGKGNLVEAIHAHYAGGSAIRRYGNGYHELAFATVGSSNPIEEDKPFLTLRSSEHFLAFQLIRK